MASLSVEKLTKRFGASLAVDDLDLSVREGELVALLGPSGCGKTTTLRMVAGFLPPTSGRVLFDKRGCHRACRPTSARPAWCFNPMRCFRT